jgi:hypothetical protein
VLEEDRKIIMERVNKYLLLRNKESNKEMKVVEGKEYHSKKIVNKNY